MQIETYIPWITLLCVLAPIGGSLLSVIMGRRGPKGVIALAAMAVSIGAAFYVFAHVWEHEALHLRIRWFSIDDHAFYIGLLLDNMAVLMMALVCAIAFAVHVYSVAYMKGDPGIHRYWVYLGLFCSAMLGLVVADNLLMLYICWELVGVASYLLIGFWFTRDAAAQANKKAFLINRIGDISFLIGIALVYTGFGTLDVTELTDPESRHTFGLNDSWLIAAGFAFFLGAMTKSAQFPLQAWLPDAMEGPTAVSSLIHAATMVAAGVFLLARIFPLFSAQVLLIIAIVGTLTALAGAYFALAQYDIKKILAFSTISQLGFMMVGIGTGAYHFALFHLTTHAFFKCLLFLGAGAVIHEMNHMKSKYRLDIDPQDIRQMGGLRTFMPVTFVVMLIASFALAGVPLTSGYLSKDAILVHAFVWAAQHPGPTMIIPYCLLAVSVLTGFYIFRLIAKVFFGSFATALTSRIPSPVHETSGWMSIPMLALAVCSLFPIFSVNPLDTNSAWLLKGLPKETVSLPSSQTFHIVVPLITTVAIALMAIVAWRWYVHGRYPLRSENLWYRFSAQQGYINVLYDRLAVRPILFLSATLFWIDRNIVDGLTRGVAHTGRYLAEVTAWTDQRIVDKFVRLVGKLAWWLGNILRRPQIGHVQHYLALLFFLLLLTLLYHMFTQR